MTKAKAEKDILWCEDCGEDPAGRRFRCKNCDRLVCGWCWNHVHQSELPDNKAKSKSSERSK